MKKRTILLILPILVALSLFTLAAVSCAKPDTDPQDTQPPSEAQDDPLPLLPVHEKDTADIDQAIASEIKYAYHNCLTAADEQRGVLRGLTPDDLYIVKYGGVHKGYHTVMINTGESYLASSVFDTSIYIEGEKITSSTNLDPFILLYKDGTFYNILDAYDLGLITKDDARAIGAAFHPEQAQTPPEEDDKTDQPSKKA